MTGINCFVMLMRRIKAKAAVRLFTIVRRQASTLASGNRAVQTRNGLNLTATGNATVEIYSLNGNLVSRQSFASGVDVEAKQSSFSIFAGYD